MSNHNLIIKAKVDSPSASPDRNRWAGSHPQKVADSGPSSTCMNTKCSTLFVLRVSISQHGRSRPLGSSLVQLMHKEAESSRPEETLCGQKKIPKRRQRKKQIRDDVLDLTGPPSLPVNVSVIIGLTDI